MIYTLICSEKYSFLFYFFVSISFFVLFTSSWVFVSSCCDYWNFQIWLSDLQTFYWFTNSPMSCWYASFGSRFVWYLVSMVIVVLNLNISWRTDVSWLIHRNDWYLIFALNFMNIAFPLFHLISNLFYFILFYFWLFISCLYW
jgi:hypothetical protein